MDEIEVPLEQAHEKMHEEAEHARERWVSMVALSSAILAVFAALAALLAGHHSNEALMKQIESSDKWAFYQAKGIKAAIMATQPKSEENQKTFERYKDEQDELKKQAEESKELSEKHLTIHENLATSVTMFQIAIAVAAISALTRRKKFWFVGLIFGCVGLGFFAFSLL